MAAVSVKRSIGRNNAAFCLFINIRIVMMQNCDSARRQKIYAHRVYVKLKRLKCSISGS